MIQSCVENLNFYNRIVIHRLLIMCYFSPHGSHIGMWVRASLFHRTGSVKIRKTRHKQSVNIRIFLRCRRRCNCRSLSRGRDRSPRRSLSRGGSRSNWRRETSAEWNADWRGLIAFNCCHVISDVSSHWYAVDKLSSTTHNSRCVYGQSLMAALSVWISSILNK